MKNNDRRRFKDVCYVTTCIAVVATICFLLSWVSYQPSIVSEPTATEQTTRQLQHKPRYNILTLGGSSTWGALLPRRVENSYPSILGARNEAIRATGATYPSYCLQTIVGESNEHFDVIVLEFSLNGHHNLELLLKRLRARYPHSIIIYVHLYSLQVDLVDNHGRTPSDIREIWERDRVEWDWGAGRDNSRVIQRQIGSLVHKYGGFVYSLPRTTHPMNSRKLFSLDWHHLSMEGHRVVAQGVKRIIEEHQSVAGTAATSSREKGTWGQGDQCFSWFMDGQLSLSHDLASSLIIFEGFGGGKKYALEFKQQGHIEFHNTGKTTVPLYLSYMTKSHFYPPASVRLGQHSLVVDPRVESVRHVMATALVGWSKPGENVVTIKPIGTWSLPFRVTGVIMCGACLEFATKADYEMLNAINTDKESG